MNTQTSLVAEQMVDQIRECQNLPFDMKRDVWCQRHGITKVNYYHYPTFYRADHGFKEAFGKRSPSGKNTPHLL